MNQIHPTAIVHPGAQLGDEVQIGPYAVIDEHVVLGDRCRVGPQVYLTGHTVIGTDNRFHAGCVIGDAPQDLKYHGEPTRLRIGAHNTFREHVTVHRSNKMEEDTVVGSHNFFMAGAHVAHNCRLGDHNIMANGATLAGHVTLHDRAFLSGYTLIHQFTRVGSLALMRGGAAISQDLPPFCIATGENHLCGLNTIGLRRAGFSAADRAELKRLYHRLFRGDEPRRAALDRAQKEFSSTPARTLLDFLASSRRGWCSDRATRAHPADAAEGD